VGSLEKFVFLESGAGTDQSHQVSGIDRARPAWADSMSLNAIAIPAAREPGPLVSRCQCLPANVDSIGSAATLASVTAEIGSVHRD
jgi:hypothetical protein